MQIGMIGLGRMGSNMVRRLLRNGHDCVAYDVNAAAVEASVQDGARGVHSLAEMVEALDAPRNLWIMVPAAFVQGTIDALAPLLSPDDTVIDGGNSWYRDDVDRAGPLAALGIHYVDVGTSGGVHGLERGYCLMVGGRPPPSDDSPPSSTRWPPASSPHRARPAATASRRRRNGAGCTADRTAPATS